MTRELVIAAASKGYSHVMSARRSLIGERIPLGGLHIDLPKAVRDLRAAHDQIGEALRLIEGASNSRTAPGSSNRQPANM